MGWAAHFRFSKENVISQRTRAKAKDSLNHSPEWYFILPLTGFSGIIRNRQQLLHFCKFRASWKSELNCLLLRFQQQKMSRAQAISNWIYWRFIQCFTGRNAKWHNREIQHKVWSIKAWKWRLLWNLEMWYWCECACL